MTLKQTLATAALMLFTASSALAGGPQRVGDASARFTGKGPAGFKLEGTTSELQLEDDGTTVRITVPLAKLDTGIELRNRHMREKYLETDKHPNAVLEVVRASIQLPAEGQQATGRGTGKMTLHGKTKDVSFKYVIKRANGVYTTDAKVPLNLKDFGIHIPSYLGVTVKPDIEAAVGFSFKE